MSAATPPVSAIIPTFNGRRFLDACLTSLRAQTLALHEIIVVDDASTDDTPQWVAAEWPHVKLVRRETNGGYAAAVNAGIRAATGEVVAILNDDLECAPDCLAEWLAGLEAIPAVAVAAPKLLFADARATVNSAGLAPGPNGHNMDRGYGMADGPAWQHRRLVFGACGAAMLVRRSVFERVGLLDTWMFMYYEDVDWAFRAQALGYRCRFVPAARAYHREGGSRGALPRPMLYYHARNRLWVVFTHYTGPMLVRFGPHVAVATVRQLIGDLTRRRTLAGWRGVAAAVRGMPRVWRRRRLLQYARHGRANDIAGWLRANAIETVGTKMDWRRAGQGVA